MYRWSPTVIVVISLLILVETHRIPKARDGNTLQPLSWVKDPDEDEAHDFPGDDDLDEDPSVISHEDDGSVHQNPSSWGWHKYITSFFQTSGQTEGVPIYNSVKKPIWPKVTKNKKITKSMIRKYEKLVHVPGKCPSECNGHGKCVKDRGQMKKDKNTGNWIYPYVCVCNYMWAGDSCNQPYDQLFRWIQSNGTSIQPICCPICEQSYEAPWQDGDIPRYTNPFYDYMDPDCFKGVPFDPKRPGLAYGPDCRRPLAMVSPYKSPIASSSENLKQALWANDEQNGAFASSWFELTAESFPSNGRTRKRKQPKEDKKGECCVMCETRPTDEPHLFKTGDPQLDDRNMRIYYRQRRRYDSCIVCHISN